MQNDKQLINTFFYVGGNMNSIDNIKRRNNKICALNLKEETGELIDSPQEIGHKIKIFGGSMFSSLYYYHNVLHFQV